MLAAPAQAHGAPLTFLGLAVTPPAELHLSSLVAGFVILVVGLALLTLRSHRATLQSPQSTRRALGYAVIYALCVACFGRVVGPALLGGDRSPWLLALADVLFVTTGLFAWVMVLAEGHPLSAYGLQRTSRGRLGIGLVMGLLAVAFFAYGAYASLITQEVRPNADVWVYALLIGTFGSAIPEELLFRGYLMASLDGRTRRWSRVATSAIVFTVVRAFRYPPGPGFATPDWMSYMFGVVLPLGLLWGLMRELSGGNLWPSLVSHFLIEFGHAAAGTSPAYA
jgi:membrane protease YdiL (CAAX protease family)